MARQTKEGLKYFSFDVDFFDDEKIGAISGEFGIKGEITAIKLLCAVYRNGYFTVWNEPLKMKLLKSLPGINTELLEQIVNRLVRWGFFASSCFSSDKILTSEGIQKRYFEAIKRRKPKEEYPYLLINVDNNTLNVYRNSENVYKGTQRKGKEINNPLFIPPFDLDAVVSLTDLRPLVFNNEQVWYEKIGMTLHLTPQEITGWINNFFNELECTGEVLKSMRDFKSHFFRWLKIQLKEKKEVKNEKESRNSDAIYKRRG